MKRKFISFAIAFALLSQTIAFAGPLTTAVTGVFSGPSTRPDVSTKVTCSVDSEETKSFNYSIGIDMQKVRDEFNSLYAEGLAASGALATDFNNSLVTGSFTITLDHESGMSLTNDTTTLISVLNSQLPATSIFTVTDVTTTADGKKTTITVAVKGGTTVAYLNSNVNTYLADMTFTVGLTASFEKSDIIASFVGTVELVESDELTPTKNPFFQIGFNGGDAASALTVQVYKPASSGSGSYSSGGGSGSGTWSGGTTTGPTTPTVTPDPTKDVSSTFITDGEGEEPVVATLNERTGVIEITGGSGTHSTTATPPEKAGFIANGYSDTPFAGGDKNYDGVSTGTGSRFYPRYVNVTVPAALAQDTDENGNPLHKSYISGYPDGEVKPNNNISREEVTAAFDRLLNTVFRATIATTSQNFPDVAGDRWSNDSIATMANGGFIVGDESGNFNPSKPITRAEFAVIAAKFAPANAELGENYFTDIDGHWAKDYILKIAGQYWISGYTDGSFNPNGYITRAEAMAIINRMLVRYGDEDAEIGKEWPDVSAADWYHDIVKEATNNNVFERTENGWSEKWVQE